MHKPIIPLTLAYTTGLLLGHGFLYFPYSIGSLLMVSILLSGILTWLNKLDLRRTTLIILPCLIGMTAYIYSAAWFPSDHYTRRFRPDKETHEVIGKIASPLDRDPDRTGFVLELSKIDSTPVTGRVRVSIREEVSTIGYGDLIRFSSKLFEPIGFNNPGGFDYAGFLARSGVYYTVSVKNAEKIEVLKRGSGVFRTIQDRRERIRQAFLASTSGPGSALLQAMTLGEEGRLTDELRDRFMAAGVTHIISISGSHLGMVAVLCFGLIRGLMFLIPERWYHRLTIYSDPKKIAAWLTLPLVIFYTLLAGGQVATVRSLIMVSAGLTALILDRESALMHSLALAALFILIASPQAIFDISFQLSYLSVLVIGYVVSLWNELQFKTVNRFQKIRNSVVLLIVISLAASLATGPLVARYFNQFSLAGIISNMIVVPFAGMVVVPFGLTSGIASLFTHSLPLPELNQLIADVFIGAVAFFSRLPFAQFHPPAPGMVRLALSALFLFSLFGYAGARLRFRFKPLESSSRISGVPVIGMVLPGVLLILSFAPLFMQQHETLVSFPDVGQGDCALIEFSSGKTVLIDGGGARNSRFDIGRRILAPYLWNKGVRRLDLVVLSHPHPDHMNGLVFILKEFNVAEVWDSGLDTDLPGYAEFRKMIDEKKIHHRIVSADDPPVMLGAATLSVLHPAPGFKAHDQQAYAAENNRSLVVQVRSEGRVFAFTGDIGSGAEGALFRTAQGLKCDLLKVPHHGSKSSSSDAFISKTRPELAVVTVGRGNQYRHPSGEVITRYENAGTRIYRTGSDGAVTIRIGNNRLDAVRWNDRILKRLSLPDRAAWEGRERKNWSRLLLRAAAF